MRNYTDERKKELREVICNQCGRTFQAENGIVKEDCIHMDIVFGYFNSRDGMNHHFDLCEACYEKMIRAFRIPVTEEEETELL
ncbi:MAG: hypothetical protein GX234_09820 [Clostridiales bacterium]|nr:hypothetical protein [Clostridiales bacterium]